jgi:hypothetical protein
MFFFIGCRFIGHLKVFMFDKVGVILYLALPVTRGAQEVYGNIVKPFILNIETKKAS